MGHFGTPPGPRIKKKPGYGLHLREGNEGYRKRPDAVGEMLGEGLGDWLVEVDWDEHSLLFPSPSPCQPTGLL
jgi:hypothetical protein